MKINIKNQNILITGSAGGIGSSICKVFDEDENNFLITGTNENKLSKFSQELKSNSKFIACDFRDHKNIQKIVNKVNEEFDSKIDILINNAGITRDNIMLRMQEDEWDNVIDVHLNGQYLLIKSFIKRMVKNRWGRIINISSTSAVLGNKGQAGLMPGQFVSPHSIAYDSQGNLYIGDVVETDWKQVFGNLKRPESIRRFQRLKCLGDWPKNS